VHTLGLSQVICVLQRMVRDDIAAPVDFSAVSPTPSRPTEKILRMRDEKLSWKVDPINETLGKIGRKDTI
jgi:hypothetical protein